MSASGKVSVDFTGEDARLLERLDRLADALGRSRSWLVRDAVVHYLRMREREIPFTRQSRDENDNYR